MAYTFGGVGFFPEMVIELPFHSIIGRIYTFVSKVAVSQRQRCECAVVFCFLDLEDGGDQERLGRPQERGNRFLLHVFIFGEGLEMV